LRTAARGLGPRRTRKYVYRKLERIMKKKNNSRSLAAAIRPGNKLKTRSLGRRAENINASSTAAAAAAADSESRGRRSRNRRHARDGYLIFHIFRVGSTRARAPEAVCPPRFHVWCLPRFARSVIVSHTIILIK